MNWSMCILHNSDSIQSKIARPQNFINNLQDGALNHKETFNFKDLVIMSAEFPAAFVPQVTISLLIA